MRDQRFYCAALLALVLVSSFLLKLNHLGHGAIKGLDESFHALVARNLTHHPLTPTLYDKPYLPYDYRDWQNNHVWLHKPIVPLWQMAASMAAFGVNTLAMRLPSAILSTAAVWLTYAIGVELLRDRRAALIAAALQAFNPGIVSLVQGYVFSDHVDVAFLFWVELAAWLLIVAIDRTSTGWLIAAGVAQGIAYHCKTYPAFVLTLIAIVACASRPSLNSRRLLVFIAATLAAIGPWSLWCLLKFRQEFLYEQLQVFRHLSSDVEGWAAPWDRLIFDFSIRIYHVFYPAVIAAAVVLAPRAWRTRDRGLVLLYTWGLGVLVPLTIATSKTPTATLIGWPPFLLLLAALIVRAIDGDPWCLGAWLGATLIGVIWRGTIPQIGWGYPNPPRFAAIMRENIWVLWHVLAAVLVAMALGSAMKRSLRRRVAVPLIIVAALASALLFARMTYIGYRVTAVARETPSFAELGAATRGNLPPNAVFLFEIREKCEHIMAMFYVERTIYPVAPANREQVAQEITKAGGLPLLLTDKNLPLPRVFDRALDGLNVYAVGTTPPTR